MNEIRIAALVLPVLAPVFAGWLALRLQLLHAGDARPLTSAYLYLFLPALIVNDLSRQNLSTLFDVRFIVATICLMLAIYGGVFFFQKVLLRHSLASSTLAAFAAAKFNAVIVGLPLLLIAVGHQAIVAVIINMIIGYFTVLPLTLFLLEIAKTQNQDGPTNYARVVTGALKHVVLDPLVIATVTGILLAALKLTLPDWLHQSLDILAKGAVPVPLVAVGITIGAASFKDYKQDIGEALWISAIRVVASPVLAIAVARLLALSPVYSIALVISFSLPTAKMAFALAEDNGVYVKAMAAIVTLTTVSIVIGYPAFLWICERLWPGVIQNIN
jgi:malonate transporter